jgi:bacillithiol biosynthesis deacetylase BshB1
MPVEVLLFGAHPDDVEWAAGGVALLLRNEGVAFGVIDMTEGEMGSRGTVAERRVESARASKTMGARIRENLGLPDCGLIDLPDYRGAVASSIRRHRPRVVIAPFWEDRHPDHAAAGRLVQNARLLCGLPTLTDGNEPHRPDAFLYYPIHNFHQPTFVIDTSAVYQQKLELMRIYDSQFGKANPTEFLYRLESRDRYYGSIIGVHHGEALISDQPIALSSLKPLLSLLA